MTINITMGITTNITISIIDLFDKTMNMTPKISINIEIGITKDVETGTIIGIPIDIITDIWILTQL